MASNPDEILAEISSMFLGPSSHRPKRFVRTRVSCLNCRRQRRSGESWQIFCDDCPKHVRTLKVGGA